MQLEIVRDTEGFRQLAGSWNALLEASESRSIFLTWEWLFRWWQHFGGGKVLHIIVVKDGDGGTLRGIAPLCAELVRLPAGMSLRKLRFLGSEKVSSDFLDFIVHPAARDEVRDSMETYFLEQRREWDVIELTDLDSTAVVLDFLRGGWGKEITCFQRPASVCPYLSLGTDYAGFLASLRSSMRYNLKRKLRKYNGNRELTLTRSAETDDMRARFDQLFALHREGFKMKTGSQAAVSNFSGDEIRRFHHDVVADYASQHRLAMYFAGYRERVIGCLYTFRYKGRSFYYQSGLDRSWDKWSVGTVLLDYCIQDSIRDGFDEFHFLRGMEEYKFRWTRTFKWTRDVIMVNSTARGRLYGAAMYAKTVMRNVRNSVIRNSAMKWEREHV